MKIAILVLVVIGALLVIASGVWVAFALISAISCPANDKDSARQKPKSGD